VEMSIAYAVFTKSFFFFFFVRVSSFFLYVSGSICQRETRRIPKTKISMQTGSMFTNAGGFQQYLDNSF
jgi:hypothetical protein